MTASDAVGRQAVEPAENQPGAAVAIADPAAWAVTAFATTSFMLGMFQTGLLNSAGTPIVLPTAFFFGGLVPLT